VYIYPSLVNGRPNHGSLFTGCAKTRKARIHVYTDRVDLNLDHLCKAPLSGKRCFTIIIAGLVKLLDKLCVLTHAHSHTAARVRTRTQTHTHTLLRTQDMQLFFCNSKGWSVEKIVAWLH
jgi:hypothetical protein